MKCNSCGSHNLTVIDEKFYQCENCFKRILIPVEVNVPLSNVEESNIKDQGSETSIDYGEIQEAVVRINSPHGSATGFFINKNGYVLTNEHVVKDLEIIQGFIGASPIVSEFELVASAQTLGYDLALLKLISEHPYQTIEVSEKPPKLGDAIIAIGNPRNLGISISKGFISRLSKDEYQLDITVNPGNSGGPVLNEQGQCIAVISYSIQEVQGMGFAISLDVIEKFIEIVNSSPSYVDSNQSQREIGYDFTDDDSIDFDYMNFEDENTEDNIKSEYFKNFEDVFEDERERKEDSNHGESSEDDLENSFNEEDKVDV